MTNLTIQYLEAPPPGTQPEAVHETLRRAFGILPISKVLLGWNLPPRLEEAAAEETARHNALLFRWHPLLTTDTDFPLPREWQTVGPDGNPIAGFKNMDSFTFLCPNRAAVQEWVAERIEAALSRGIYQGLFFDRMRLPSPAADPARELACFCPQCTRLAADAGLDLEPVRRAIGRAATDGEAARALIRCLIEDKPGRGDEALQAFMAFRIHSVTRLVRFATRQAQSAGLSVGFDCFSPALARMVGQDLTALGDLKAWIKIMTYPHVFGPAGLPFELLALAGWLAILGMPEDEALAFLAEANELPIPALAQAREHGLAPDVMRSETLRARALTQSPIYTGVALVHMQGVHTASDDLLREDLVACREAKPDGLALSWDLRLITPQRLEMIREY